MVNYFGDGSRLRSGSRGWASRPAGWARRPSSQLAVGGRYPHLLRRRPAQRDPSGIGVESQSVVIVSPCDVYPGPGTNAALFQEFQQAAVAFVDAADHVVASRLGMRQQQQAAPAPAGGTLQFAQIAVRTGTAASQSGQQ